MSQAWAQGQPATTAVDTLRTTAPKKHWYENLGMRGYVQVRYNRLLETNDQFRLDADKSVGDNGGFYIRRARWVLSGQVQARIFIYTQIDLAGSAGTTNNLASIRDLYADLGLDAKNEFRIRIGQSKVPFGFENMQSSQNRLPQDRAEALNTACQGERDLGVYLMWAPRAKRDLLKKLVDDGLKGSGDYGMVTVGAYNGQGLNRSEANDEPHVVGRITWPFEWGGQIIEIGAMGYTGTYVVTSDQRSAAVHGNSDFSYTEHRLGGSVVLYSRPVGILAEYNIGRGPAYESATDSITTRDLGGGFVTVNYRATIEHHTLSPFIRYQAYQGGGKAQLDARLLDINDVEVGVEWQPNKNFELTTEYYVGDRTTSDLVKEGNVQQGQLLRIQAQFNF